MGEIIYKFLKPLNYLKANLGNITLLDLCFGYSVIKWQNHKMRLGSVHTNMCSPIMFWYIIINPQIFLVRVSSPPHFDGVCVAQSLVFSVMLCEPSSVFSWLLSVLEVTTSDYPYDIFNCFFNIFNAILMIIYLVTVT